jgi:hypothetical protein
MSRVVRWEQDASQPDGLRDAIEAARAAGPSEREIEQLIASVRGMVAGAGKSAQGGAAGAAGAGGSAVIGQRLLVRAGVPVLAFVTAFGLTAVYRALPRPGAPAVKAPVVNTPDLPAPPPIAASDLPLAAAAPSPPLARAPAPVEKPVSVPAAKREKLRGEHVKSLDSAPALVAPASPLEEARLLRAAKQALPTAPELAAERLEEHRRTFPNGVFVEEREALEIEVLFDRGQVAQAVARAEQFRKRYPNSNYLRRISSKRSAAAKGSESSAGE